MPNVTSSGSRSATVNARSKSATNAASSSMAWSEGSTAKAVSSPNHAAAAAIAGAVFRPTGSPTTIAPGHSRWQASTRASEVITTMFAAGTSLVARANVAASSVRPPEASGSNCLGRAGRAPRPEPLAATAGQDQCATLDRGLGHVA